MKKSLARLDLNLLFTLQLLLQEQSVSKASKKLNVTPSTVSKSLNKLRHWFDDPLFVKTPKGLAPTPLAQSMEQDLAEKRSDITPKGVRFDITIESPLVLTVLDRLIVAIHQRYPEAKVKTSNWDYDSLDAIIRGEADIGFTGRESHPRSKESLDLLPYFLDFEILFYDLPMVYLHKDHPALQQEWNLETFLSYQHINIVWEKSETWALDEVLTELGLQRSIGLTMSNFEQSLFMAAQPTHDMITTAPHYCKSYTEKLHLDLVCLPIPLDQAQQDKLLIPFTMIWHKRNAYNPKLLWLKNTIKSLYKQPSQPQ
ncbi:HTH-type transcriptional regulator YidZ [Vibrio sp. 779(2023)]|uniref:HTH-type transcriptional regulator YidZ n=1 Tax=Vibrio sp. 779(2023) TaxID=3074712 RepID=UPI0029670BC6|nr:HTH-type transcriptional regulator YidZ [Vibrio sp. 779(2023)]MDW3150948.1 HTH-type transcriptional regulator YidZ [Vibrio sp. 779(2023)]